MGMLQSKAQLVRNPLSYDFTRAMSFKVLNQLENLTPVLKCIEIELPSVSCLNNCKIFSALSSKGGARGVIVIVVGNGHGDTSSNPGRD